ncbi:ubiquinone biosynthesis O-methyltransferase, mitochondrial-like [Manihot esculenta]|uniref:ubiquinone biosynthesis O-methyltransferase, mitochondrial-like n=1 Tax=Manihot esculenta TaxID=3983 RepID=UPI000B5D3672|nr:ubiquinone biosynthesis O-methyltransferase, mitochondrial-like [Manihot esculenta]
MASKLLMGAIRYPNRFFNATGKFFSYRPMSTTPPSSPLGNGKTVDEKSQHKLSLNDDTLAKFSAIADTCWDPEGPYKPVHAMNPNRLAFIRSTLCQHFRKDPQMARPFEGLSIVDVGCGGGRLSELEWEQL